MEIEHAVEIEHSVEIEHGVLIEHTVEIEHLNIKKKKCSISTACSIFAELTLKSVILFLLCFKNSSYKNSKYESHFCLG